MSDTKEPYKWYWAYTSTCVNDYTFIFDTHEQALEHAMENGEFDEICGKDSMIEHEQNLIFQIREDELGDYLNVQFPLNEVK